MSLLGCLECTEEVAVVEIMLHVLNRRLKVAVLVNGTSCGIALGERVEDTLL